MRGGRNFYADFLRMSAAAKMVRRVKPELQPPPPLEPGLFTAFALVEVWSVVLVPSVVDLLLPPPLLLSCAHIVPLPEQRVHVSVLLPLQFEHLPLPLHWLHFMSSPLVTP